MKPYYEHAGITIYHGDCRDQLGNFLDRVLVTDPPYGIDLQNHGRGDGRRRRDSFAIAGDEDSAIGQFVIDSFCENPRIVFASPKKPWSGDWTQFLVWDKGPAVGGGGHPKACWKFTWELIQVSGLGMLSGQRDQSVLRYWVVPQDSSDHPAEKPLDLITYLLFKGTSGKAIIDPFMGTGTTLEAAKMLNLSAVGFEIEERYCEIAAKRLAQEVLDFTPPPAPEP